MAFPEGSPETCATQSTLSENDWIQLLTLGVKCTRAQNVCALQQHSLAAETFQPGDQVRDQACMKHTAQLRAQSRNRGKAKLNREAFPETTAYSKAKNN